MQSLTSLAGDGPQIPWYSKWAGHAGKPASMKASPSNAPVAQNNAIRDNAVSTRVAFAGKTRDTHCHPTYRQLVQSTRTLDDNIRMSRLEETYLIDDN
jgi:hypothetical protein